jgi:glycosyltransferase involved in cell wall biosynthesis
MSSPFFSVVTPSWNQGGFLRGCVESVLAQGGGDFEHLVFDNLSTDGTAQVATGFPHLRFFGERDSGQSEAVNKGLRLAQGEVLCWWGFCSCGLSWCRFCISSFDQQN